MKAQKLNAAQARKYIEEMPKFRYDDDIAVEVLTYRKGSLDFAGKKSNFLNFK